MGANSPLHFFWSLHVNWPGRYHLRVTRSRLFLALGATLAGAIGAVALATTQAPDPALQPLSGPVSQPLGERLGINEGVSVPKRLIEREGLGLSLIHI